MKKKCFLFITLIVLLFSFRTASAEADYTKEADMLNLLGLFNGTASGYELDRVPTRVESAAMLVRLMGAEKEANEMKYEHPFTDVPAWADSIVGYMYEKGYTKGIGNNQFGSARIAVAGDYTTFMLRSLGYGDSEFNYAEALDFAVSKEIISSEEARELQEKQFRRNEMVLISYRTLKAHVKGDNIPLSERLVDSGVISAQKAYDAGVAEYEVLPVRIYKVNGKTTIDIYYSKLSPEIKKMNAMVHQTNKKEDYSDMDFLARMSILSKSEKARNRHNYSDSTGEAYNETMNIEVKFFDSNYILSYFCYITSPLAEGEYNFVVIPIGNDAKNSMIKYQKEFDDYVSEKVKKINTIPLKAYKLESADGKDYIIIDKSKLPASMKDVAYFNQSGQSDDKIDDDIERMLKRSFTRPNEKTHDEFVDLEPLKLNYAHTYTLFTLLDNNEEVIGAMLIAPQY